MMRLAVVSNPNSRQNRHRPAAIRAVLSAHPEVIHAETAHIGELDDLLRVLARQKVGLLVVDGGDGTVQSVLTALFNGCMFEQLPLLAVLPTGMTNLIAHDIGLRGTPSEALKRLIRLSQQTTALTKVDRRVLRVAHATDRPPSFGMFLGTAAFYRGTVLGHQDVHPLGVERWTAAGLTLGLFIWHALFRTKTSQSIYRGDRMTISVDGARGEERDYFLVLATTLNRLILGLMPFWGDGSGLRLTSLPFPPPRFARCMVPLMRGRPRPGMAEAGYRSCRAEKVELAMNCPLVLDGEILVPQADVPVQLSAEHRVAFVRC